MNQVVSERFIEEQGDDDNYKGVKEKQTANLQKSMQEDYDKKLKFLESEQLNNYGQILVISQIRMDFCNDDPFLRHLLNVEKAIRRGVRDILLKLNKIQTKEQFKQMQDNLLRIFYDDVNIGFITSTGQIKSTAFIYMHKNLIDIFNRQKTNFQFEKIAVKMALYFYAIETKNLQPIQSSIFNIKTAFIRTNKFFNEFLVLSQTSQEELKSGISIFFVYRPIDDQIYAVKRVKLQSSKISFFDVFSTGSMNELTPDQRKIREAKILSKLTHPGLLKLYDWWIEEANEVCYLYMQLEYVSFPGYKYQTTDLLTFSYFYMNPLGNVEKMKKIKMIMFQLLDGLEYIHTRGIVHRDLKPENVFITISITGELQVIIADFDQGKDVREQKLSQLTEEKLSGEELNSIKTQNTIKTGTSGYQTPNYNKYGNYDESDEFYALGVTLLHLVITFPGDPKNRNHYAKTFAMSETDEILPLLDNWAVKFVRNRHEEFKFAYFKMVFELAKKLITKTIKDHNEIKQYIEMFQ